MANEKIYPKGIQTFEPHANAPDFVLGTVIITMRDLIAWIKENENLLTEYNGKKQLKLQLTKSRDGRPSFSVDTYKPAEKPAEKPASNEPVSDDLPF